MSTAPQDAARAVGLGDIYDFLCEREGADTPTGRTVINILGAVAQYLHESGYTVTDHA